MGTAPVDIVQPRHTPRPRPLGLYAVVAAVALAGVGGPVWYVAWSATEDARAREAYGGEYRRLCQEEDGLLVRMREHLNTRTAYIALTGSDPSRAERMKPEVDETDRHVAKIEVELDPLMRRAAALELRWGVRWTGLGLPWRTHNPANWK